MEPVIRPARGEDLPAVLSLWRRAGAEPSHTDDIPSLRLLVAHDSGALLIAEAAGQIVGSVIAAWDGWRGSVYRLAVAPELRRQGLGRRLVSAAENRLTARCRASPDNRRGFRAAGNGLLAVECLG